MSDIAPPGWITRTRADRLTAALQKGMDDILSRLTERIAPLVAAESDKGRVHQILTREIATAKAEIGALNATMLERINAGDEH
jgi:hypothetical protein